jgi:N-acetylglucosaminyldiphosphoundecaprenol N-acetyl-beta-D-mannosaminyltransferase
LQRGRTDRAAFKVAPFPSLGIRNPAIGKRTALSYDHRQMRRIANQAQNPFCSRPAATLNQPQDATHRVDFLGVPIDLLTMDRTVAIAVDAMRTRRPVTHVALNVAKFVKMRSDAELNRDVVTADIIGLDGMGIVLALRLFGVRRAERVPGVDLMFALMAACAERGLRPFILGARREALDQAKTIAEERWPGLSFAGTRDGYFTAEQEPGVVEEIRASGADCLFVAMPTPRKERFLQRHRKDLDVPFVMGVGGSVDVLAGVVSRAPQWMQRAGLEWFHRLLQEPRKMAWRYVSTNTAFLGILLTGFARQWRGQPVIRTVSK